jgi:two-component system LytT family response regulator
MKMQGIKTVIIEDEEFGRKTLTSLLDRYVPEVELVGFAENATDGAELINKLQPQLVLLDIEMPYVSGIQMLSMFKEINFHVIFITAYDQYAIAAIRAGALDYLLKPIDVTELKEAIQKVSQRVEVDNLVKVKKETLERIDEVHKLESLALPGTDGLTFIKVVDIITLQADGNYTHIFLKDGKKVMVSKQLNEFEDRLPQQIFCRVHHSYIINLKFVTSYVKGRGGYVIMVDNSRVDVSQRKRDEFLERFRG